MQTVRQLLDGKSADLVQVTPDAPVFEAIRRMAEAHVGAVLVLDEGRLAGILSERDYARKVVLAGRSSRETAVREIMTADVTTATPAQTVHACMALMTQRRFRHLPVMDDGVVVGIVSIGDLVAAVITDQRAELDQLQRYISG